MSRFLGKAAGKMAPYIPGEQLRDREYIKLNANENSYPPAPGVQELLQAYSSAKLRLYPDTQSGALRDAMAESFGVAAENVFVGGGSDEVLGFSFMAFFDEGDKVYFPDISYGFYEIYAKLCKLDAKTIPLRQDFTLSPQDYFGLDGHIVIANPNAPTGIAITPTQIEQILQHNPDRLVLVDEAYIDFSDGKTCVPLTEQYDNLLIVQTYSKSRSLAGMRIGCAVGNKALIEDICRIKDSFNPFNLDHVSIEVGVAATKDTAYLKETCGKICATRDKTKQQLEELGFTVLPSETNFLFASTPQISGADLYQKMKENGVLIRHFNKDRIRDFNRITIGTEQEMAQFIQAVKTVLASL